MKEAKHPPLVRLGARTSASMRHARRTTGALSKGASMTASSFTITPVPPTVLKREPSRMGEGNSNEDEGERNVNRPGIGSHGGKDLWNITSVRYLEI
jgi:hypothetical protein